MGIFIKVLFAFIAVIVILSVGIGIIGAVLGITVGLVGALFGCAWELITSPFILILIIIVLALKLNKASTAK